MGQDRRENVVKCGCRPAVHRSSSATTQARLECGQQSPIAANGWFSKNSFLRIALLQVGQLLKQLPLSLAKLLGQAYLCLHKQIAALLGIPQMGHALGRAVETSGLAGCRLEYAARLCL